MLINKYVNSTDRLLKMSQGAIDHKNWGIFAGAWPKAQERICKYLDPFLNGL